MNAVVPIEQERAIVPTTPAAMLMTAIERGADVGALERLMDMQERWQREEARKAYAAAMKAVQAEAPKIAKDAHNSQTKSDYAKLDAINAGLVPVYTRHGFSLSFSQGDSDKEGHIRIACQVAHELGHVETRHVDLPLDMTGIQGSVNKTAIHATGSTYSYGRRYLTCMIFNVSTGDDDDGQAAGTGELEKLVQDHDRLVKHNALVRDWIETIYVIKISIRDGDLERAIEASCEMDNETKIAINIAPTYGGIFTTKEREIMKSDEWARTKRAFLGSPEPAK